MVKCKKCNQEMTLKKWWKKHRLNWLLEWQAKFVANTTGIGIDHRKHPKYKQSEKLIRKCGFYDEFGVKEA